jgi:hypothetical protein
MTQNIGTSTEVVKSECAEDPSLLKYTAEIVQQEDCPKSLRDLQKQIAAHLDKADKYDEKADQHRTSASQLFARVQELCDEGGFAAFHEKFFPNLGRSRVYESLAIGTGKKSVEDIRASTRERVARHRANKATSVTVTDTPSDIIGTDEDPSIAEHRARMAALAADDVINAVFDSVIDGHAADHDGADQLLAQGEEVNGAPASAAPSAKASKKNLLIWECWRNSSRRPAAPTSLPASPPPGSTK